MQQDATEDVRVPFPEEQNLHRLTNFDIPNFLLKTNNGRNRRPYFAVLVVWSASYALAKTLQREGSISSSSFYGQLSDYYSHAFFLSYLVDELVQGVL